MSVAVLLAVDDRPDNLFVLEQVVGTYLPEIKMITAESAEAGLALAATEAIDGALIDVQMPGHERHRDVPPAQSRSPNRAYPCHPGDRAPGHSRIEGPGAGSRGRRLYRQAHRQCRTGRQAQGHAAAPGRGTGAPPGAGPSGRDGPGTHPSIAGRRISLPDPVPMPPRTPSSSATWKDICWK